MDDSSGERLCRSADLEERGRAWVWDVLQYRQPVRAFSAASISSVPGNSTSSCWRAK